MSDGSWRVLTILILTSSESGPFPALKAPGHSHRSGLLPAFPPAPIFPSCFNYVSSPTDYSPTLAILHKGTLVP